MSLAGVQTPSPLNDKYGFNLVLQAIRSTQKLAKIRYDCGKAGVESRDTNDHTKWLINQLKESSVQLELLYKEIEEGEPLIVRKRH